MQDEHYRLVVCLKWTKLRCKIFKILPSIPESLSVVSHLISEDVGQDPAHREDDEQQQHEHRVGQQQAFHLLGGGEAPEHGEEDGEVADDDDDVGGVGVEVVPQQLRHEQLVIHGPDAECEENKAADLEYNNPVFRNKT